MALEIQFSIELKNRNKKRAMVTHDINVIEKPIKINC